MKKSDTIKYYWLEYEDETTAVSNLKEKGLISDDEDFAPPLSVVHLGHVPEYDRTDPDNPVKISESKYLVNAWGYYDVDFGEYSKPDPASPYCIPGGYRSPYQTENPVE